MAKTEAHFPPQAVSVLFPGIVLAVDLVITTVINQKKAKFPPNSSDKEDKHTLAQYFFYKSLDFKIK